SAPPSVQVYTAQDRYGLASPGSCGNEPCKQYVLQLTEKRTLASDQGRSEVFLSGCLHGDERVGPTALMETVWLLVK
ncbi:unnamed protein product, partial [Phaeothamnion confervicola]